MRLRLVYEKHKLRPAVRPLRGGVWSGFQVCTSLRTSVLVSFSSWPVIVSRHSNGLRPIRTPKEVSQ